MNFRKLVLILLALSLMLVACTEDAEAPEVVEEPTEAAAVVEEAEEPEAVEEVEETEVVEEVEEPEVVEVETPMLVDDLGKEFSVDEPFTRIVSLAPSVTESLFALGAGEQVVGRDDFTFFPAEALDVPSFGSLWDGVPVETILGMEPDLVVAGGVISPEQIVELETVGLTVYYQADPVDFDGLYETLMQLAVLTGHEAEGEALIADLQARTAVVEEGVAALEGDMPVVFYELDATDPNAPWTTGSGTFIDFVIRKAGGVNAAAELEGAYAMFSSEALIAANPDFILLADAEFGVTVESVETRAGWETIKAVVDGNIVPVESSLFSLPGPRLVDGLEFLFETLH